MCKTIECRNHYIFDSRGGQTEEKIGKRKDKEEKGKEMKQVREDRRGEGGWSRCVRFRGTRGDCDAALRRKRRTEAGTVTITSIT